ncbi:MAG: hypothetical protein U9Q80_09460 [Bacillota bacterium]|nr:hypothetical protein [Bacillota bacterium]
MKKIISIILVFSMLMSSAVFADTSTNLEHLISQSDDLSPSLKKIAKDVIKNEENIWIDNYFNGEVVKVYTTNIENTYVSFTGDIVEVITVNNGEITINDKSFGRIDVKVVRNDLKIEDKIEKEIEKLTKKGQIFSIRSIFGSSYIEISNPGGSWVSYSDEYINFSTSNPFVTYTVGALSVVLGITAAFSGVPGGITLAAAGAIITESAAPTKVGQVHRVLKKSLDFFNTYRISDTTYVMNEGASTVASFETWYEAWAGL